MNGEVIKQFLVGLGFKVDDAGLKRFEGGIKSATVAVAAVGTVAVTAATAVVAFVGAVADKLDSVGDTADRIGTTADELMRFQYVATLSGSSAEQAASSMENMGRVIGEASLGVGRGAMMFEKLGLSAKKADGSLKTSSEVLGEIGDKIKDLSRAEQVAFLAKFGIDPSLIGAITGGMKELGGEFDALYKAAGVNLNDAASASGDFNDGLDRLKLTFEALKTAVAIRFMPQITRSFNTLRKLIVENLPRIIKTISPIFDVILRVADAVITLATRIGSAVGVIIGWFAKVNTITDGWAGYIIAAVVAWKKLNLAFLASPIGMLIALGAAVALLVDDFLTWQEGGEALLDWGGEWGTSLKVLTAALTALFSGIILVKGAVLAYTAASGALLAIQKAWAIGTQIMTFAQWALNVALAANPIGAVIIAIVALIAAGALLVANWDSVKAWFTGFFDWILGMFSQLGDAIKGVASFFGMGGENVKAVSGKTGGRPASAPSPQAASNVTKNSSQTLNQKTEIVVNGSKDPQATARAVQGAQTQANANMARNMAGAAR